MVTPPFKMGTQEWLTSASIADALALVLIRMDRSGVFQLEIQRTLPVPTPYEQVSQALRGICALLVPANQVEDLYRYLTSGESALRYTAND